MGTRAYIGIKNEDGTVTAIYNQCDGGLQNLGHILRKYFKSEEQIRELTELGMISSIQENADYEDLLKQFPEVENPREWTSLQTVPECKVHLMPCGEPAEQGKNINEFIGVMICYAYLFIPGEDKWYYTKGKKLNPLKA